VSERIALIIGNGGREHAFVKSLGSDVKIFISPGNAGTAIMPNVTNVTLDDPVAFAKENNVDFAIIGPDSFIAAGLADQFRAANIPVFGASQAAGRLESSKSFASTFMERHGIPQPKSTTVHSVDELADDTDPLSIVLKADGLALGKGVVLPETAEEAKTTLKEMLEGIGYEGAGKEGVVIQERLHGPEVSAFALTDGTNFVMLPFSQDHKRLKTGDIGPNTGGMGAYAPLPESIVSPEQAQKIHDIAKKTVDGMKADGTPYQSVIYIGLMLAEQRDGDPVVIEYNARFGDPETQVILTLLQDAGVDVYELLKSTDSTLNTSLLDGITFDKTAITVCVAASGYPESPRKGDEILGLDTTLPDGVFVHNAGTKLEDGGKIVTNGGRVLYVTSVADDIDTAAVNAYSVIDENGIHFDGMQYRTDIGKQARTM
jgi:phosphoribosylamine--glycine ligase